MENNKQTENNSAEILTETYPDNPSGFLLQIYDFRYLLFGVSLALVGGTAISRLDLFTSVLLGCVVLGFNFYLTMQFVRKLLSARKLFAPDLLFYLTKFGISVLILFMALNYLELSPVGLLIGLSNVAFTTVIYSIINVLRPLKSSYAVQQKTKT